MKTLPSTMPLWVWKHKIAFALGLRIIALMQLKNAMDQMTDSILKFAQAFRDVEIPSSDLEDE
jgi:hypothetical protein